MAQPVETETSGCVPGSRQPGTPVALEATPRPRPEASLSIHLVFPVFSLCRERTPSGNQSKGPAASQCPRLLTATGISLTMSSITERACPHKDVGSQGGGELTGAEAELALGPRWADQPRSSVGGLVDTRPQGPRKWRALPSWLCKAGTVQIGQREGPTPSLEKAPFTVSLRAPQGSPIWCLSRSPPPHPHPEGLSVPRQGYQGHICTQGLSTPTPHPQYCKALICLLLRCGFAFFQNACFASESFHLKIAWEDSSMLSSLSLFRF